MAPIVSVIVPCHNLGRYLDECVESVLGQSYQHFEILIVNDGSTDPDTCRLLDQSRPRTRVVHSRNNGLPSARNLGLSRTTGEYVCMLDPDDVLEPSMLEKSVAALERDRTVAFVSHWVRLFGDEEYDWKPTDCDFPVLLDANTVNGAAVVRRAAIEAVGGYDETMRDGCEDWDLWITLVERGYRGRILQEVLFRYRRRADSMSRVMMDGGRFVPLFRRLIEKHRDTYDGHLPALILRRERDISALRSHTWDLQLEAESWLAPELARRRDDAAACEETTIATAPAPQEGERAAQERTEALQALDIAINCARERDAAAHRAESALDAVRDSLSWRATAPARRAYEAIAALWRLKP